MIARLRRRTLCRTATRSPPSTSRRWCPGLETTCSLHFSLCCPSPQRAKSCLTLSRRRRRLRKSSPAAQVDTSQINTPPVSGFESRLCFLTFHLVVTHIGRYPDIKGLRKSQFIRATDSTWSCFIFHGQCLHKSLLPLEGGGCFLGVGTAMADAGRQAG